MTVLEQFQNQFELIGDVKLKETLISLFVKSNSKIFTNIKKLRLVIAQIQKLKEIHKVLKLDRVSRDLVISALLISHLNPYRRANLKLFFAPYPDIARTLSELKYLKKLVYLIEAKDLFSEGNKVKIIFELCWSTTLNENTSSSVVDSDLVICPDAVYF